MKQYKLSHPLYYNPEYNCLHQLIEVNKKYITITGDCSYVNDTETIISRFKVNPSYIKKLILIRPQHISRSKYLHVCSSVGYLRVHKHIDNSYLFYKDENVISSNG